MPRRSEPRLFIATQTASVPDPEGGAHITVLAGHLIVDDQDPLYQAHPELFGPLRVRQYRHVEQATAAPGERR